jgi:iron complex transport system permease protein
VTESHLTWRRLARTLAVLTVLLLVSIGASVALGPVDIDWLGLLAAGEPAATDRTIVFSTRLPRILLGVVVGGALGCSGAALQGLLANPLADPHLLGVSAGAAVAGAMALLLGADPVSPLVPLAAFAGALLTVATVYRAARADGRTTPHAILLIGVVCNALAASVIMLVNAVAGYAQVQGVLFWIMGSLSTQRYAVVGLAAVYVVVGVAALMRHAQALNLLAAGEEGASSLGVDVERTRRAVFVWASLLVGAAVSVSGMINFVGLIVPHLLRLVVGPDHRLLLPASVLGGAILLVWSDTAARLLLAPAELPVGVVTALLGGPFFIYLLRRGLRRGLA